MTWPLTVSVFAKAGTDDATMTDAATTLAKKFLMRATPFQRARTFRLYASCGDESIGSAAELGNLEVGIEVLRVVVAVAGIPHANRILIDARLRIWATRVTQFLAGEDAR